MPKKLSINGVKSALSDKGYELLNRGTVSKATLISIKCMKCESVRQIVAGSYMAPGECSICKPVIEEKDENTVLQAKSEDFRVRIN